MFIILKDVPQLQHPMLEIPDLHSSNTALGQLRDNIFAIVSSPCGRSFNRAVETSKCWLFEVSLFMAEGNLKLHAFLSKYVYPYHILSQCHRRPSLGWFFPNGFLILTCLLCWRSIIWSRVLHPVVVHLPCVCFQTGSI